MSLLDTRVMMSKREKEERLQSEIRSTPFSFSPEKRIVRRELQEEKEG